MNEKYITKALTKAVYTGFEFLKTKKSPIFGWKTPGLRWYCDKYCAWAVPEDCMTVECPEPQDIHEHRTDTYDYMLVSTGIVKTVCEKPKRQVRVFRDDQTGKQVAINDNMLKLFDALGSYSLMWDGKEQHAVGVFDTASQQFVGIIMPVKLKDEIKL